MRKIDLRNFETNFLIFNFCFFADKLGFTYFRFLGPKQQGMFFLFFEGLSYSFASEAPDQAPREPTDGTDGRTPDLKVFSFFLGAGI